MRRLSPSYIATCVAIALGSTAALAQLQIQPVNPGTNANNAPTGTANATGTAAVGGCVGTGGSTCTATTTNTSASATGTTGSAAPSETAGPGNVTAPAATGSPATAASSGASPSEPFTPEFVNNAAADAPFRTTPNTPDATPTGAALGRSPGQTSSGTAAGNSSSGIDAGSQNLGTVNPAGNTLGNTALVPGVAVAGTTGAVIGTGVSTNGARVTAGNGGVVTFDAPTPTPIFELTARQGAEREARRRARGEEPRVYGIAPRTDRDLTHQMPDDPIIRY